MTNIGESHDMCHEQEGGEGGPQRTERPRQPRAPLCCPLCAKIIRTASPSEKSEGRQRWRCLPSKIDCPIKQVFLPTFWEGGSRTYLSMTIFLMEVKLPAWSR